MHLRYHTYDSWQSKKQKFIIQAIDPAAPPIKGREVIFQRVTFILLFLALQSMLQLVVMSPKAKLS